MATKGHLQLLVEYAAARTILAALGLLPISLALKFGEGTGAVAYRLAQELRRTGERNLSLVFPDKSQSERRELLRGCFRSLGRGLGLFSKFSTGTPETLLSLVELHGLENLALARTSNRGVILFTAHLGSWELTSLALSLVGEPLSFLVRRLDNQKVEQLIDRSRTRFGNKTLDKLSAARSMVKILRSGEMLGLLLDLNTLDEEAIFVDFFGVPASTNFMVAKLALRTNSPIVPIFAPWDSTKRKFVLQIEPAVPFETTGNEEKDVRKLTGDLSLIIENYIRRYPDQWLWIHKRWKTRPQGEPDLYR